MILKQSEKAACLQHVRQSLPCLLLDSNIQLDQSSQNELIEYIVNDISFKYFPGSLLILLMAITIIPLFLYPFMTAFGYSVHIPEDCTNQALKALSITQLKILSAKIEEILSQYEEQKPTGSPEKENKVNKATSFQYQRKLYTEQQASLQSCIESPKDVRDDSFRSVKLP